MLLADASQRDKESSDWKVRRDQTWIESLKAILRLIWTLDDII